MINPNLIKDNPEKIKYALDKKHIKVDFEKLSKLDADRRILIIQTDELRAQQKQFNNKISSLSAVDKEQALIDMKSLALDLRQKERELSEIEKQWKTLVYMLPNIPAEEVPEGKDDKENVVIKTVGEKPQFDFQPKSHEQLMLALDLVDFEQAAKVSGQKFYYLKNEATILEMSIMRFAMDWMVKQGFVPMTTPDLVKKEAMYGAAHFPPEEDAYKIDEDGLYLAGTAEVGLVNYFAGKNFDAKDLPQRVCGFSACFRRESGTYGKQAGGLYRIHQFHKIEMVSVVEKGKDVEEHEKLLDISEKILQELGLSYQVVLNCGGDLGLPQYKKFDIETWMAGRGSYGETHSCSNDTDFQARRIGLKVKGKDGTDYACTLNNTVLASPRVMIPIIENNQTKDGDIIIPKALVPYTGFSEIKRKKQ